MKGCTLRAEAKLKTPLIIYLVLLFLPLFFSDSSVSREEISKYDYLTAAAKKFLSTFSEDRLNSLKFDFTDEERLNWHYVPKSREGIPLKELNDNQYKLFRDLLSASLSKKGVDKAKGVIMLESVLYELSGNSSYRDPGSYYISFFGTPDKINPWGWRFEGHHLSLNFTSIKESIIISTPLFMGANPAEVKEGKHKGLRVLKSEEDLARELVKSFNKGQLKKALIDEDAPGEIITENEERVDPLNPKGLTGSGLNKNQQAVLTALIEEYINNSEPEFAEQRYMDFRKEDIKNIYFAWAGGFEKGEPHYYRIQSSTFLIEYDNTQNNANHIHSVWRSFKNDFGTDLLKKHYKNYHQ
jgi:hypothetical protein